MMDGPIGSFAAYSVGIIYTNSGGTTAGFFIILAAYMIASEIKNGGIKCK